MVGYWETPMMEGKNPQHTSGFFSFYDSRDFSQEDYIARESIQNSIDAGKNVDGITEIEFRELNIRGQEKSDLISLLEFDELLAPRFNRKEMKETKHQGFISYIEKFLKDDQISALLISDRNTCGLGGNWKEHNTGDHFSKLVCATGLNDKADNDPNSGGSYGLGKTVYARASLLHTVLYHSSFLPTDKTNNTHRRFMATGIYPRHKFEEKNYGGYAYGGIENPEKPGEAMPFEDDKARDIWSKITSLFNLNSFRDKDDHGTDVLILMTQLDFNEFKQSVETWYFPAIIEGSVNIKFYEADQNEPSFPRPLERADLDQFVRLTNEAKGKTQDKSETKILGSLNKYKQGDNNLGLGRYAFEVAESDEANSDRTNHVAIMRGTGMIINYQKLGHDNHEAAVGAFVADEDVWKYLIISENPAHSEWSHLSDRLQREYPDIGKQVVTRLNRSLKSEFQKFQKALQPDISKSRSDSGLLAKLLSGALGGGGSGNKDVEQGEPTPVSISCTRQEKTRNPDSSNWRLRVSSNEHTPEEEFKLKITPKISLAGEKMVPLNHMDMSVLDASGNILKRGNKPELIFTFQRGIDLNLTISFQNPGRYNNYVVRCDFERLTED